MLLLGPPARPAARAEERPPRALPSAAAMALPAPRPGVRRLPPVERPIATVAHAESSRRQWPPVAGAVAHQPEEVQGERVAEENSYSIDLPTALRLGDAENWQIAIAREQIVAALARVDAANALWLPSVRGGINYNRHDGAIQDVRGIQFNTTRQALYSGLGAGIYGAGTPMFPGLYANFHLADALFLPLAARQFAGSRYRAAAAATNDTLLQISLAYLDLLRAGQDLAIAESVHGDAARLADITKAYADTGQGLRADANRAQTELSIRANDVQRARESQGVASARLAQLLRLDPTVQLSPLEPAVVPVELVPLHVPVKELVARGLSSRPELAEAQLLVGEAVARLRRERFAPLIPSILMGASYGGMGAGVNTDMAGFRDRLDLDAVAYWELRNFGFGDAAARRGAQSAVCVSQFRQMSMMDQVAREVTEAHIQVRARSAQIAIAEQGVRAAMDSYRQNLARIEEAKGLPIEVLQSIQALAQAQREYLRSVIDYNAAQFTLYRALGWPQKTPGQLQPPPGP
jgi:outer membrane protein TolC